MSTGTWRSRPAAPESSRLSASSAWRLRMVWRSKAILPASSTRNSIASLVVEDHLRFESLLALGFLVQFDQAFGIEQRIGVALEAARVPGQIDQQPVQDLPGVGAGRLVADHRPPHSLEALTFRLREIEGLVGPVRIEERSVIADRAAPRRRLPDILPDLRAGPRQLRQEFDPHTWRCRATRDPMSRHPGSAAACGSAPSGPCPP